MKIRRVVTKTLCIIPDLQLTSSHIERILLPPNTNDNKNIKTQMFCFQIYILFYNINGLQDKYKINNKIK